MFSDKGPKRHPNASRVRQKYKEREGEEFGGRKRLTQIEFTSISSIDQKQIFTVSATGSKISLSTQTPKDLIQTGCPSVTVSAHTLPLEDVLIIYCAGENVCI